MSPALFLIWTPDLFLTSNAAGIYRTQRRIIVGCCPWFRSLSNRQNKRFENAPLPENCSVCPEKHVAQKKIGLGYILRTSRFLPCMEIQFPFNFIVILISFSIFALIIKGWKNIITTPDRHSRLPPGPPRLPVIGHLHHLISSLPHHYPLRDLSEKYGPLMHLKFGEVYAIVVSSSDMAKEVLKTHE